MQKLSACRVCGGRALVPFFDLGKQPLANSLLISKKQRHAVYPLSLVWCAACRLAQLDYTVPPARLFSRYVWVTGTSETAREFAPVFYKEIVARTPRARDGYVLELASNDGTFLKPFIRGGFTVLGVDPARNVVRMAKKSGIPTLCAFWNMATARRLVKERGKARMIFARNVIAHVANPRDFMASIAHALDDDGVVAVEPHYAVDIQAGCQYDSIYHEHLCYFTLGSLERLLNAAGLHAFDALKSPISGGAIIVYASKQRHPPSARLKDYRRQETMRRVNSLAAWRRFARTAERHRSRFRALLEKLRTKRASVVGWGASARSSTLLNAAGVGPDLIAEIADKNPLKHGRYTAGTRIRIDAPERVMRKHPKYVVILGWNFTKEIEAELRSRFRFRGKCVLPLPGMPRIR